MKTALNRLLLFLAYCVAWLYVKCACFTCRVKHQGPLPDYLKNNRPVLLAWWHQDMIFNFAFLVRFARKRKIGAIVSRSRDGGFAAYVIRKLGLFTFRGSSSRGGFEAFEGLVSLIRKEGAIGVIVCDGPRPPARVAKFGIVALSRQTGLPIIMVRSWGKRQYLFKKSWPKLAIPYPFSPIVMLSAGPLTVPSTATRDELEKYRRQVEEGLNRLADESERYFV